MDVLVIQRLLRVCAFGWQCDDAVSAGAFADAGVCVARGNANAWGKCFRDAPPRFGGVANV